MKKFEYIIIEGLASINEENLNKYGEMGWELVAIIPTSGIGGNTKAILKRKKQD